MQNIEEIKKQYNKNLAIAKSDYSIQASTIKTKPISNVGKLTSVKY